MGRLRARHCEVVVRLYCSMYEHIRFSSHRRRVAIVFDKPHYFWWCSSFVCRRRYSVVLMTIFIFIVSSFLRRPVRRILPQPNVDWRKGRGWCGCVCNSVPSSIPLDSPIVRLLQDDILRYSLYLETIIIHSSCQTIDDGRASRDSSRTYRHTYSAVVRYATRLFFRWDD